MTGRRRVWELAVAVAYAAALAPVGVTAQELDETCTAAALNRTSRVAPNGTFTIPNVPSNLGFFRVRLSCEQPDGTLRQGQSGLLVPVEDGSFPIGEIELDVVPPIPVSLEVVAPVTALDGAGEVVQLESTGELADGSREDLTAGSTGTNYFSSNPEIATVTADGLVTAVSPGTVLVSVRNEGVLSTVRVTVLGGDRDGDGLPDEFELANGLDPDDPTDAGVDLDGDTLTNLEEFLAGTDVRAADTDLGGLLDGEELTAGTNPLLADSDGDGLTDGREAWRGTDPLVADSDGDGLPDGVELTLGLNPLAVDSDVDGIDDGFEDFDGDGLNNLEELRQFTDPTDPDSDDDGLGDGQEVLLGEDPLVPESMPPTVAVTSPVDGATLLEGETVTFLVDASDLYGLVSVDLIVDDTATTVTTFGTPPFTLPYTVPTGITTVRFRATAVDIAGNVGAAQEVVVDVVPDPLTTVVGRVRQLAGGDGVEAVAVSTTAGGSAFTDADGQFTLEDVPTVLGDLFAVAQTDFRDAEVEVTSATFAPVRGGVTDVGDVVLFPAAVNPFPGSVLADGAAQADVVIHLPGQTRVAVTARPFRSFPTLGASAGGDILEGTPSPSGHGFQVLDVVDDFVVVTYQAPLLVLPAGQVRTAIVDVEGVDQDDHVTGVLEFGTIRLVSKSESRVRVEPGVFLDAAPEPGAVTIENIVDADGNPVPDGTECAVLASTCDGAFCPAVSAGTIEGGTASVCNGAKVRIFPVVNGRIVADYRAPDLALRSGQSVTRFVQAWSLRPTDGCALSHTGQGSVRIVAKTASLVSVIPARFLDGEEAPATVTITNVVDTDGNPVPDGTECAVLASNCDGAFCPAVSAGTIEGGTASLCNGSLVRIFPVENGQITASYRAPYLALRASQSRRRYVQVWSVRDGDGCVLSRTGQDSVRIVARSAARVTVEPNEYFDGEDAAGIVTITNVVDTDGNPVPDGTECAVLASNCDGAFCPAVSAGTIEGGTASTCNGSLVRIFPVVNGQITATYRQPYLGLRADQSARRYVQAWSVRDDNGCVLSRTGQDSVTITGP